MNCPFCNELNIKQRILELGNHAFVLLSNPRLLKGHSLVIPNRHIEYPGELTSEEIIDIFQLIEKVRAKILDSGIATGVDIRQNYRPFLTQSREKVNHVHFHVLPRSNEDELYQRSMRFEAELFADLPEEELQEVKRLLL